jgi:enterochelin esterase family protein
LSRTPYAPPQALVPASGVRSNARSRRLEICVGDKDSLTAGSKALAGVLEKRGIKHEVHISGGGHTWINWRHYLSEFAPKLFR